MPLTDSGSLLNVFLMITASQIAQNFGFNFTQDYVTPNERQWFQFLEPLRGQPHLRYLEIGIYEGRSLFWILENILTHPTSTAYAIDPFDLLTFELQGTKELFVSNLMKAPRKNQVKFFNSFSHKILNEFDRDFFDLAYVDGSHDAEAVELDLEQTTPLLKKGALLMIDDYGYRPPPESQIQPPKLGIDRFMMKNKNQFEVLYWKYQIILRKD